MNIIEWCNNNNGFLLALLSFMSLIISVTAVSVSIHTARLPFQKKVRLHVNYSINEKGETELVTIFAVNVGNRDVVITFLGLVEGKRGKNKQLTEYWISSSPDYLNENNLIKPGEKYDYQMALSLYREMISRVGNFNNTFVCAKDSEGKRYFQKIQLQRL